MGQEQPSEYYDKVYLDYPAYTDHYSESGYYKLWQAMEKFLVPNIPVLDIGCGTGQAAQFLIEKGYKYTGIDFSKYAIEKAKSLQLERAEFIEENVVEIKDWSIYDGYQVWSSEFLEHISDDVGLMTKLSVQLEGSNIVLSVPNFDDPAHLRHFKSNRQLLRRYGNFIDKKSAYKKLQIEQFFIFSGKLSLNTRSTIFQRILSPLY